MKLNLEDLNPGTFFPFEEGSDDKGGVTIRLANSEILDEIAKRCTKTKFEYRRGQRFEITTVDEELKGEILWNYVIIDWSGLFDLQGNDIPCTKENKLMLMKKSVKFSSFVSKSVEALSEKISEYNEDLEKN